MIKEIILHCNDLEISKDGTFLYFTESSSRYPRSKVFSIAIEGCPNGKLFKYSFVTKKVSLVVDKLYFPNGLVFLDQNQDELIVSETMRSRLLKIKCSTSTVTVFADNLPGLPDNLKIEEGLLWVGLSNKRQHPFSISDWMAERSWLRILLFSMLPPDLVTTIFPQYGLVIAVNLSDAEIAKSLHDPTGQFSKISEVHFSGSKIYFGSWFHDFVLELDKSYLGE